MRRELTLGVVIACWSALDWRGGVSGAASGAGHAAGDRPPQTQGQPLRPDELPFLAIAPRSAAATSSVFITDTGVTLVDSKLAGWGQAMLDKIKTVTTKPVTMIINTHTHGDHTGNDDFFGPNVEIVAHENTKTNMAKMDAFKGTKSIYLPRKVYTDKMTIGTGKDRIDLFYFGPGHTNGDTWVVFPDLRVLHTGDMVAWKDAPLCDRNNGGSCVVVPENAGQRRRRHQERRHRDSRSHGHDHDEGRRGVSALHDRSGGRRAGGDEGRKDGGRGGGGPEPGGEVSDLQVRAREGGRPVDLRRAQAVTARLRSLPTRLTACSAARLALLLISAAIAGTLVRETWDVRPLHAQSRDAMRWYKGNLHTHTLNSDGDSTPDDVVKWYREHGYQFLVLTDHNYLTSVDGLNALHGADDKFLVVKGEEVTGGRATSRFTSTDSTSIELVDPPTGSTVVEVAQRMVDAIRAAQGIPSINHPNFEWAIQSPMSSARFSARACSRSSTAIPL